MRDFRKIPDETYASLEPYLLEHYRNRTKRRPIIHELRDIVDGIYFVVRTGCQWKAVPDYYPPPSTLHRHFQQWSSCDILKDFWEGTIETFDQIIGLDVSNQYVDGCITKAPYGGDCTGRNPTDRGKQGTKRSVLVEGNGVTLSVEFGGANVHDNRLLVSTLDMAEEFLENHHTPELVQNPDEFPDQDPDLRIQENIEQERHIYLDKGYDAAWIRATLDERGYVHHIPRRGEQDIPEQRAGRWIVEASNSWLNNYRRVRVRKERSIQNYKSMVYFSLGLINLKKIINQSV